MTKADSIQPSCDDTPASSSIEEQVIPVLAEKLSVERRLVETGRVRATITTKSHEHVIKEHLVHESVEVERIPIGRTVDAYPPVREEGDTTIIPVVEEVLVIERRLFLKEEVHLRRVRVVDTYTATIVTRSQDVVVTRVDEHTRPAGDPAAADHSDRNANQQGSQQ